MTPDAVLVAKVKAFVADYGWSGSEGYIAFGIGSDGRERRITFSELTGLCEAVERLTRERDEAQANYRFMVEKAADESLAGYRELAERAAKAENDAAAFRAELAGLREGAKVEYGIRGKSGNVRQNVILGEHMQRIEVTADEMQDVAEAWNGGQGRDKPYTVVTRTVTTPEWVEYDRAARTGDR